MILCGDVRERLREIPDESVHCVVTSPPYWGLRDYGVDGQLGLEATPEEYVANMVEVFREVRRVLRTDGTLWLNLGDSYAGSWGAQGRDGAMADRSVVSARQIENHPRFGSRTGARDRTPGLKPKDLVGIPWRVAFALQADGWWLRSDIIWSKQNPMPESVRDRPTKAHEYVFLLTKSARYYYDADAIAEPATYPNGMNGRGPVTSPHGQGFAAGRSDGSTDGTRNRRTVWEIATKPYPEAHFATFPPELPDLCIKAGCPKGGTVLDPFAGAGTTLWRAQELGRRGIGIELNPEYVALIERRCAQSVLFAPTEPETEGQP